ncbi:hypothetical protein HPC38_02475 [Pasteurellaceae bacterium HPA106]|uniref:hypothetical protein n=1 Tax=Spirabiliibacterium pneumoniae TaxID=221400 RepID=UPI001AAC99AF|nr:hypothetical protein [Spirabiliibacterium pneumoniae]MBE2895745.1 hypothetical protein [Spirabiliibacterium pneumoniae]
MASYCYISSQIADHAEYLSKIDRIDDQIIEKSDELVEEYLSLKGDYFIENDIQDIPESDDENIEYLYQKLAFDDEYIKAIKSHDSTKASAIRNDYAQEIIKGEIKWII